MAGAESPDFSAIIGRPPYLRPGDSQLLTSAASFDGLIVPEPDRYHFAVLVDGRGVNQASFRPSSRGHGSSRCGCQPGSAVALGDYFLADRGGPAGNGATSCPFTLFRGHRWPAGGFARCARTRPRL